MHVWRWTSALVELCMLRSRAVKARNFSTRLSYRFDRYHMLILVQVSSIDDDSRGSDVLFSNGGRNWQWIVLQQEEEIIWNDIVKQKCSKKADHGHKQFLYWVKRIRSCSCKIGDNFIIASLLVVSHFVVLTTWLLTVCTCSPKASIHHYHSHHHRLHMHQSVDFKIQLPSSAPTTMQCDNVQQGCWREGVLLAVLYVPV